MSKRKPPSRWTLPEDVSPLTNICFQVPVPNDPMHIAAFKGAILALAYQKNWGRDDANTARDVAAVWMGIFNNLEECEAMTVQFRQLTDCFLEVSFDGGSTWATIFDASACVTQGVLDAIDSGSVAPGGGVAPGGAGNAGQCYSYKVKLEANQRWTPPIGILTGDTITVSNVQGAWYDNELSPFGSWRCGDGTLFFGGVCVDSTGSTVGTDPAPAIDHMRLIGSYESEGYFDMYEVSHTINGGAASQFFLQANDSTLDGNSGALTFDVEICKGTEWCVIYDFQTHASQFGWNAEYVGSWNGTRFVSSDNSNYRGVRIYLEIPSGTTITEMRLGFDRTLGAWDSDGIAIDEFYGTNTGGSGGGFGIHAWFRPPDFNGTDIVREINGLSIVGPKRIYLQTFAAATSGAHSGSSAINYVRLRGTGNPTASGNPC